jgi:photosystem II stability/assembly factor-like uncharacterized protein
MATMKLALLLALAATQWQTLPVPSKASFRGLSAVDDNIVWASGSEGTVLRTTDGGKTWTKLKVPKTEDLDFRGIRAFDDKTAVIMSSGPAEKGQARVYRTTDAGQHWTQVLEEKTTGAFFDAIAFWDSKHGILLGDPVEGSFMIYTTQDAGETWQRVAPEKLPAALPNEGAFAASNSCLAVEGKSNVWFGTGGASVARVFRSTNLGQSWFVFNTPVQPHNASTGIFSLVFQGELHGMAVGGDYQQPDALFPNPLNANDGGRAWQRIGPPQGRFLSSIAVAPGTGRMPGKVFAAGPSGIYSLSSFGQWVQHSDLNVNVIAFPTAKSGWAAGPKGLIARWNIEPASGVHKP